MCRQLKYHQHSIRSNIGILLEIISNVSKCLIVSLVPLKFLLWQQHHFCLFLLALSVNLPLCQVCTFYCPLTKKRFNILPKGTGVDMHQHIHQKDLILCLHHVTMPRLFLNCKKHKQEIQLCYGAYNETKKHFEIPICFWFQWISLRNLFLIKFWKISGFIFGLWFYVYDFWFHDTNDFKSPLNPCR